jgi:DNA primase
VRQAVPLSTFLLEAAADGCDLATAEGRSHMVSNAAPLWKLLPDGALKRQLLGEIAERAQLAPQELMELWGLASPRGEERPRRRQRDGGEAPYRKRAYGAGQRQPVKPRAVAFAEQVGRMMLRNTEGWHGLTDADHHLLCQLPAPHGDLFSWIDTRFHEHGGEPWAVLQVALEGQPFAELATRLVDLDNMQPIGRALDVEEFGERELQRAMVEIHLDALNEEEKRVMQLAPTDPARSEQLYEVIRRTKELTQRRQALVQLSRNRGS